MGQIKNIKLHIITDIKYNTTTKKMSKTEKDTKNEKPAIPKGTKAEKEDNEKKSNLGALEEDDDFEEFPTEDWTEENLNVDVMQVWEDDWDDDDVEDDFSQQLRTELVKHGQTTKKK